MKIEARINVPLGKDELAALIGMANADCRHPREQMRYLLRLEAERRGLLLAGPMQPVQIIEVEVERERAG